MAWPLTPLTTYLAGLPPGVKAFDLNAIQTTLNQLFNGSISVKSLIADAVGGVATALPAGEIQANRSVSSATFPNPITHTGSGVLCRATGVLGWVLVDALGNLGHGYNVISGPGSVRTGVGTYVVLFGSTPASAAAACPQVTPTGAGLIPKASAALVGPNLQITVTIYNPVTGAATDGSFALAVFGEA